MKSFLAILFLINAVVASTANSPSRGLRHSSVVAGESKERKVVEGSKRCYNSKQELKNDVNRYLADPMARDPASS